MTRDTLTLTLRTARFTAVALGGLAALATTASASEQRCQALAGAVHEAHGLRVTQAVFHAGTQSAELRMPPMLARRFDLPAHCEIVAATPDRKGLDGQLYAIRLRLRLPERWNERFFFQGGGGSNGDTGNAYGLLDSAGATAIEQGYAVLSQDSGHDNARNSDPARSGELAFGFDPKARADYGHASLKPAAEAGLWLLGRYYERAPRYRYFVGCSKGGQEGMVFAQQHPEVFDGIIAGAPGMSLPKAALAQAWDTQVFGRLVGTPGERRFEIAKLPTAFTRSQLGLVREAVLEACDAQDGLRDGIVADTAGCTDDKVRASLATKTCATGASGADCLSAAQVEALAASVQGPRDAKGQALYSRWFWPSGISDDGWRVWKLGLEGGFVPPLNVALGARALASVFTTPPVAIAPGLQALADYQMAFDFERDAARVLAVAPPFERSAWQDVGARSTDLGRFAVRRGRLLVPHGESDPVFSLADTLAWYDEVNQRAGGKAADFVRVFPVPGMAHCSGGPATDRYDAFGALVRWVEQGQAPDRLEAAAGPATPWMGRTRPLCPYPQVARYKGQGDPESSSSFECSAGAAASPRS